MLSSEKKKVADATCNACSCNPLLNGEKCLKRFQKDCLIVCQEIEKVQKAEAKKG